MLAKLDGSREFLQMAAEYEARVAAEPSIPRNAEIMPDCSPAWHILTTGPRQECTAAGHLAGRRFGVYVPQVELTVVRRGFKRDITEPLFPGYIFLFVWNIDRQRDRIMACCGVTSIMRRIDGSAVVLPDDLVDEIREVENGERPLHMTIEVVSMKKRKRKTRRTLKEIPVDDLDIVGVKSYSPFDRIAELDQAARSSLLLNALGLAS